MTKIGLAFLTALAAQQTAVLAIGGHAGDMEVSAGAARARVARVVLLHLTLGENGHQAVGGPDCIRFRGDRRRDVIVHPGQEFFQMRGKYGVAFDNEDAWAKH